MKRRSLKSPAEGDHRSSRVVSFYRSDMIWYCLSVLLRIVWTVIFPQHGYIHPDEFFQGPEIVFDDVFQTNLTRMHEFHPEAPLRSVAILYLLYGLPVFILSWLSSLFQWSVVPFHWKLVLPRSSLLILSFGADVLFYRLIKLFHARLNSKQQGIIMNYYGIAHVTVVFFTRTLSNSVESFLFLALIYLIVLNITLVLGKIAKQSRKEKTLMMDVQLTFTSASIGLTCALGIFNRPTFPAFAVVPVLYWFITLVPSTSYSSRVQLFLGRIITVILGAFLLTSSLLILFDSYYYNQGFSFVIDMKNRLIVCPLNFILYNMDPNNLDKHGLHPPWLHFLVNATLLFGPLHLCAVVWALSQLMSLKQWIKSIITRLLLVFRQKPSNVASSERSTVPLLCCLYFVPFLPLSIVPHQEARFLLPLLFPLLLLIVPLLITHHFHRSIFRLWFAFNVLLALLYGHLHQGGLLPGLHYVHDSFSPRSNAAPMTAKNFLITYHTYMPPGYLVTPMSSYRTEPSTSTAVIDLQGAPREQLLRTIDDVFRRHGTDRIEVFVLLPGTCRTDLTESKEQQYHFHRREQFGPHLDFDRPIHLRYSSIREIWEQSQLDVYQIMRD